MILTNRDYEEKPGSPLGQPTTRVDGFAKVTGAAQYIEDIQGRFPGLLHIQVLRSPYAHAEIVEIDTDEAAGMPGVAAILTGADCPRTYERSEVFSLPAERNATWAGQCVAAVAADSPEAAAAALARIRVEYKELPFVLDVKQAMLADPPAVVDPRMGSYPGGRQYTPEAPNIASHQKVRRGDINEGFAQADLVVENEYHCRRISHGQIERAGCIAQPDADRKGLYMYTNGCGVHLLKQLLCKLLGLAGSRVQVEQQTMGGSFGNRLAWSVEPLCALFALKTGRPCLYRLSREEMFIGSPSNWPVTVRIKTGVTKEGVITAQEMTVIEDCGAHQNNVRDGRSTASGAVPVYRVPHFYQDIYTVNTNTPPVGSMRGLGSPQISFAVEQQLSILADRLGISQLAIREKNILDKLEEDPYGETLLSTGAKACIRAVAQAIGLDEPPDQPAQGPWRVGRGIGIAGKQNTPQGRSEAAVRVYDDGSLEVLVGCDENGMGAETVMAQIVAHEFGEDIRRVTVTRGNTELTPYDNFSSSSRTTYNTGNAVRLACLDAKRQLCEAAAEMAGVVPGRVEISGGRAWIIGGTVDCIPIPKLFRPFNMFEAQQTRALRTMSPVEGRGVFAPAPAVRWDPEDGQTPRMWNWYQYSACGAEVAVNTETGQTRVLRYVSAADMGYPVNPQLCQGQMHGGLAMASSFARNEEYLYNPQGQVANGSFMDYRIATILDTPTLANVGTIFCPDPLPDGPYGAKGIAESITCPVAPAIAQAIYNAVGVRPREMPMSAESLLALLRDKESRDES